MGVFDLLRPNRAKPQRSEQRRQQVQRDLTGLSLYQFRSCPYCVRVRRALRELDIDVPLRDIRREPRYRAELIAGGGRAMVPCLRVAADGDGDDRWLYESADIIAYLRARFAD